ncbi:hypothetical protein [Streptomyces sp. NPDC054975]
MPAKGVHGSERLLLQPLATQTSQQEAALLSTGPGLWEEAALALAVDNYQGAPRGASDPLPTQVGSETLAVVSSGVIPYRKNTVPAVHTEPMSTFTAEQIPGVLTAAGWFKQNGPTGTETAAHPVTGPLGTLTSRDTTALLTARWGPALSQVPFEECFYRMMSAPEIGRGCGFDVNFRKYVVRPLLRPGIGERLRAVLHTSHDESRYNNHRYRCPKCRAAATKGRARRRAEQGGADEQPAPALQSPTSFLLPRLSSWTEQHAA